MLLAGAGEAAAEAEAEREDEDEEDEEEVVEVEEVAIEAVAEVAAEEAITLASTVIEDPVAVGMTPSVAVDVMTPVDSALLVKGPGTTLFSAVNMKSISSSVSESARASRPSA